MQVSTVEDIASQLVEQEDPPIDFGGPAHPGGSGRFWAIELASRSVIVLNRDLGDAHELLSRSFHPVIDHSGPSVVYDNEHVLILNVGGGIEHAIRALQVAGFQATLLLKRQLQHGFVVDESIEEQDMSEIDFGENFGLDVQRLDALIWEDPDEVQKFNELLYKYLHDVVPDLSIQDAVNQLPDAMKRQFKLDLRPFERREEQGPLSPDSGLNPDISTKSYSPISSRPGIEPVGRAEEPPGRVGVAAVRLPDGTILSDPAADSIEDLLRRKGFTADDIAAMQRDNVAFEMETGWIDAAGVFQAESSVDKAVNRLLADE